MATSGPGISSWLMVAVCRENRCGLGEIEPCRAESGDGDGDQVKLLERERDRCRRCAALAQKKFGEGEPPD